MTTPVIFFAYNRPQQTLRVLDALSCQSVRPAEVLAFSDGPARPEDEAGVREVRDLLRNYRDLPITLTERPTNLGSAGNIVSGLNEIFERYPQAIVVEDDVLPSEVFCEAMERLLDVYRNQPRIFSVGGYPTIGPDALQRYPFDVILSPRFACWGWATWADRWQMVGANVLKYRPTFESPDQIPRQAGDDVVQAVRAVNKYPGRYWDYPVFLECLQRDWLHALTKAYLTNNIGLDGGVNYRPNLRLKKFVIKTNPMSREIPARFPEIELRPDVTAATRQYVAARERAASPSRLDQAYDSVQRMLRWWRGPHQNRSRPRQTLDWFWQQFLWYYRSSKSIQQGRRANLIGHDFFQFGRSLGFRLLIKAHHASWRLLSTPLSSTRYYEFSFARDSLPAKIKHCLDVSSPYLFSLYVAKRHPSAHLQIINPDLRDVQQTQSIIETLHFTNVATQPVGIESLPVRKGGYDVIWSISVIEHIQNGHHDDTWAVQQMFSALRSGGHLILTVPVDRTFRIEYRQNDCYGTQQPQVLPDGTTQTFFQRWYDADAIEQRLIRPLGIQPTRIGWYGEKQPGHFHHYIQDWIRDGNHVAVKDPELFALHYKVFDSWETMPGCGVGALLFVKP